MIEHSSRVPNFIFGDPKFCTYCGQSANSVDHVIPVSSYSEKPRKRSGSDPGVRTYACLSCNNKLGARHFETFQQRLEYIIGENTKRAQKFKRTASWSEEEIAEMDYTIRTFIANRQVEMQRADDRIIWTATPAFFGAMDTLKGVHCLDKSHPKFTEWLYSYFRGYVGN